jgi:RNA polymerase sigma factor (sigma-70 family)
VESKAVAAHLAAYLDRRAALIRFFALRTGSPTAAEDIVQEIYLKLQAMDPDAAAEVRNIAPYLYRLGSNLMLDGLRQHRRSTAREEAWRSTQADEMGGEDIASTPPADDAAHARLKLDRIIAALEKAPANSRRAFQLHKLEGLSQSETAIAMGVSRSAVEKYIAATVKMLLVEVGWP